jgi:hypothetical protein
MQIWKKAILVLIPLMLAVLVAPSAEARKGCWCWIGIERGAKLVDYGSVTDFRDTESGKKRRCSEACAGTCAADLADPARLCQKIDRPLTAAEASKVGCFSVVGHKDSPNNTWDYDGRPSSAFQGCEHRCDCPGGTWYDPNRRSCVTGVDCPVKGMPNGDKGGGFFAWEEILYLDRPGATDCRTVPSGSPSAECKWTGWLNRDRPSGNGDYEGLSDFVASGQACDSPQKVECRTRSDHRDWTQTGQTYSCTPQAGGICRNVGQTCLDYEVRFCC